MRLRHTLGHALTLTTGIIYGATMMYLLDPDVGRRRRAMIRAQMVGMRNNLRWQVEYQLRNAFCHLQGSVTEMRAKMKEGAVSDDVLEQRVRAQVGHVVLHPGSLEFICRDGHVTVRGPVLAGEGQRIKNRLRRTRGVRGWSLELREQQGTGVTPGLRGESRWQRQQNIR